MKGRQKRTHLLGEKNESTIILLCAKNIYMLNINSYLLFYFFHCLRYIALNPAALSSSSHSQFTLNLSPLSNEEKKSSKDTTLHLHNYSLAHLLYTAQSTGQASTVKVSTTNGFSTPFKKPLSILLNP